MQTNFNSVIPELPVHDVAKTVAYYQDVLGYNVNQSGKANFYFRKEDGQVGSVSCYVFVDEVDELCSSFRTQGATIVEGQEVKALVANHLLASAQQDAARDAVAASVLLRTRVGFSAPVSLCR